jgi:hypothetical protein
MPIYRGTVTKRWSGVPFDGLTWSNVYHFNTGVADDALSDAVACGVAEMAVSYAPVDVIRVHVVNVADKNDSKTIAPGSSGALDPTGLGGPLPQFNTIRVVFADTAGRPEQKYLRLAANVENIENGRWSGDFVTAVQTGYAVVVAAIASLCGPSGQDITSADTLPQVQMRQLGWHRRTREGFHRGWVPD